MTGVRTWATVLALVACFSAGSRLGHRVSAQADTVDVSMPAAVAFFVTDISSPTPGNPSPTPVTFSSASLKKNRGVRMSIRADGNFTGPGGSSIPASAVSWTVSSATGAIATGGTLGTTSYTEVLQGMADAVAGGAELSWTLAPITGPVRAGSHTLTIRWRIESVKP